MSDYVPLNCGDLVIYLSVYPPDAPILIDWLSDPEWDTGFDQALNTVGHVLEHCRSMPRGGIPRIPFGEGRYLVIGILFGANSPIVSMLPVEGD